MIGRIESRGALLAWAAAALACSSGRGGALSGDANVPSDGGGLDDAQVVGAGGDGGAVACDGGPPEGAAGASVTFAIDLGKGPARQFQPPSQPQPIPDSVYGINGFGAFVPKATRWGMIRAGGDRFTAWNWTNNYLNTGADYCFWQGQGSGGGALAGAIAQSDGQNADTIAAAQAKGEAFLATVPIVDFVSAALDNNTGVGNLCPVSASDCNGGTASSVGVNSNNLDFVSTDPASAAFVPNVASKPGGAYCTCPPGQACPPNGCAIATSPVYQDEFVNYIRTAYGAGGAPIFFDLDNEPNYWGGAHPEIWPFTQTLPCQQYTVTYDDIVKRDETFATSIKSVWPQAKVFGPVVAQDGMLYAHSYAADPNSASEFLDYYLREMAAASAANGKALLDVLDVHYYNDGSTDPGQCVQNPRMFWDPNYTDLSASAADDVDFGWSGLNNYFDTNWYPRQIVPRLLRKIAAAYPSGVAPGLSFSEYNSGCETVIAGALAQADNLGVFGREGVFAAAAWPLQPVTDNYLIAAFDSFRNYDGKGAVVGDTAVSATTTDVASTSVYAFAHSNDSQAIDVVAINKTGAAISVNFEIDHASAFGSIALFHIVDGAAAVVPVTDAPPPIACGCGTCVIGYGLAPMSVTTMILRP